jgi:hypothetical protein
MIAAFSSSLSGIDVEVAGRTVQAGDLARKFFFRDEIERVMAWRGRSEI